MRDLTAFQQPMTTRGDIIVMNATPAPARLAKGSANTILSMSATDPQWSTLTALLDTIGSTRGAVLYRGAAGWTILAPGASGDFLKTNGAGADPAWASASGGGLTNPLTATLTWTTGLTFGSGGAGHVLGPTDDRLLVKSGSQSTANGNGQDLYLTTGAPGATTGDSGSVFFFTANGANGGSGAFNLNTGNAGGTNSVAGDVNVLVGTSKGTGAGANLRFAAGYTPHGIAGVFRFDGGFGDTMADCTFYGTLQNLVPANPGGDLVFLGGATGSGDTASELLRLRASDLSLALAGKVSTYNTIATAGWGVPAIYALGRVTAQAAAAAAIATYTPPSDGSFEVCANVLVTSAGTHNFTTTVTYTDEGGTSRTLTLPFTLVAGTALVTAIANGNGAVPYHGVPLRIRAQASTPITVQTVGTFTAVAYNAEAHIAQVA